MSDDTFGGAATPMSKEQRAERWQAGYGDAMDSARERGGMPAPLHPTRPPLDDPWRRGYLAAVNEVTPVGPCQGPCGTSVAVPGWVAVPYEGDD